MRITFIQGGGAGTHDEWDCKLVHSLEAHLGVRVEYPRMPDEGDPSYARWKPALLAAARDIVVAHSIGATMLLHALAEQPRDVTALFLIAPAFIGPGGWPSDELPARESFVVPPTVVVYQGTDDETVPAKHAQLYARAIPGAVIRILEGRDHQLGNDLREVAQDIRERCG